VDYLLNDLKVIDAASFLAGPGAATVMADYGADVIKVEPLGGDGYRTLAGNYRTDYNWQLTSRGKRSLALDLASAQTRQAMARLIESADVLIVNFFDDQLSRFQLDYESVRALNPRLIYARMSGYGTEGDEARRRGFDSTAWWARTGLMDMVRDQGQAPVMGAPGFGDHSSAMSLFGAIMLGLYRRQLTGKGCAVESSLLANGIWANGMQVQGAIAGFDVAERRQAKGWLNPFTSVYCTKDDRYLLFALINATREWPGLCAALEHPEWQQDERFQNFSDMMKHRHALKDLITEALGSATLAELAPRLAAQSLTFSIVQNLREVVADPQARANGILLETGSKDPDYQLTVDTPLRLQEESKRPPEMAPQLGEHSLEVLAELGFTSAQNQALVDAGVVRDGKPSGDSAS
jgi:crotonobetainyl-CoA:carnitine CoA-transferase CaiB-like acyl-CoA transferase